MVGLCPPRRNFTGEIALLAFLANLSGMLDNRCVHEEEAIQVLAYLLSDGAMEVYTASGISTCAHDYHVTWPVFINARIQRSLTNFVL